MSKQPPLIDRKSDYSAMFGEMAYCSCLAFLYSDHIMRLFYTVYDNGFRDNVTGEYIYFGYKGKDYTVHGGC